MSDWSTEWVEREQFGVALFETVKVIGGILQLRENQALPSQRATAAQRKGWREQEQALTKKLPGLMTQLTDEQTLEVVERYPWVVKC